MSRLSVVPWDEAAAEDYGDICAELERSGTPLGAMDMMFAAHARSVGLTLVSTDVRRFETVEGLSVATWV
jgi:tRNA(fMet)-specific endonuclease VapC